MTAIFVLAFALSNYYFANLLLGSLENRYFKPKVLTNYDAIIVLAGGTNALRSNNNHPEFNSAVDRILAAEELLRSGVAPQLLISGGSGFLSGDGHSEAFVLKNWLVKRGIKPDKIIAEPDSRTTAENASESSKIIRDRGWRRVLLITSAFHMHRSLLCFKKQGIEAIPYPVDYYTTPGYSGIETFFPAIGNLMLSSIAWKEYLGIAGYWLKGYL